jgi:hypothetical protein
MTGMCCGPNGSFSMSCTCCAKKGGNLSMPGMCCGKKVSFSISEIGHHKKVNFSMDGIGWWSKG